MNTECFEQFSEDFEKEICSEFEKIWDYVKTENSTGWTSAVNNILSKITHLRYPNVEIACSKLTDADCNEWLFDFVGYENCNSRISEIYIIAESEWRSPFTEDYERDLIYDFEKMVVARSHLRIMIFEGESESKVKHYTESLIKSVNTFKGSQNGDRYLFMGWAVASQCFRNQTYIYRK